MVVGGHAPASVLVRTIPSMRITGSRSPFRPDLPLGLDLVLSALVGAGVGAVLILELEVGRAWPW